MGVLTLEFLIAYFIGMILTRSNNWKNELVEFIKREPWNVFFLMLFVWIIICTMHSNDKYISIFGICLFTCISYASTSLNVKLENASTLNVQKDKHIKKINLGEINGYKTNCNNSYLVVWGIPKKIKNSSPQNNEVVFYNLNNKKLIK